MDFSTVCRTCLRNDTLSPIFINGTEHDIYTTDIFVITGVQIHHDDELPQNICKNCKNKLKDALDFRKMCKLTDKKLSSILKGKKTKKKNKITENQLVNQDNRDILDSITTSQHDHEEDDGINCKDHLSLESANLSIEMVEIKEDNSDIDSENIDDCYKVINESKFDLTNKIESQTELDEQLNIEKEQSKVSTRCLLKNSDNNSSETIENFDTGGTIMPKTSQNSVSEPDMPYDLIKDPITDKISKVFCKLCSKELSIKSIDSHMTKRHPGADHRRVKCDLCDSYILTKKLNRHKNMMHGNNCLMCGYCKSQFDNKDELIDHVKTCQSKKKKGKGNYSAREPQQCDICHKVMQKASLRLHKAVKHAGLKPVCQHCGKCFGNKFRLNEHYRAKHGYEKLQCNYCEFKSAGVMAMRNHERRHRGEKPFICETCGAKFHAAYLLTQHRHSHRTEKLVKCDLCPASFKANNSLHMHKLTCHSRSMYKCIVCGRSYKCRHYAVKHVRHVHQYTGSSPPLTVLTNQGEVAATNDQTQ